MVQETRVTKRLAVVLTGYEPMPASRQYQRFRRGLEYLGKTWGVEARVLEGEALEGPLPRWQAETKGPDWRVTTVVRHFNWSDLVERDFARSDLRRLVDGIAALFDFIGSGTMVRYFRSNFRYGLFFIYPLVLLASMAGTGIAAAWGLVGSGLPGAAWLAAPAAIAVFAALWALGHDKLYLAYILDDWSFAREMVYGQRVDLHERIALFADELHAEIARTDADEILLVGHSLGAAMMLEVLSRVLDRLGPPVAQASDADRPARLQLMTIGSSILKVGLHPAAADLHAAAQKVADHPDVFWVEYQARADIINFFKANPTAEMRLQVRQPPQVRTVRIRHMLEPATYKKFRSDFFRMHRQFVMGNERRYHYDYFMMLCGPVRLQSRVFAPEAAVAALGAPGRGAEIKT